MKTEPGDADTSPAPTDTLGGDGMAKLTAEQKAAMRARYYANHEQRLADGRSYYAAKFGTHEQREARQEAVKARRAAGNEVERAKARARYAANAKIRDQKITAAKVRHAENPERWHELGRTQREARRAADIEQARIIDREKALTRRSRKLAVFVESVDPLVVFERDGGICQICDRPVGDAKWHIDHVIPLARGGEHSYANTQLSHASCNLSKGTKLLDDVPTRT